MIKSILSQALRRTLIKTPFQPPTLISTSTREYYTSRTRKPTLYSKISPLGDPKTSLVPVLDDWIQNGNKVRFAELQRIIRDLRKRKRYNQALQVSEWTLKKGLFEFSTVEHAVHLNLIGRVRGFHSAESYFNNLGDNEKNNKTYGALLNCYVRQHQVDKSLCLFQKMKEMGFASSAITYNDIMSLYTNTSQHEKVLDVLREMKENNICPDNLSYRICINSCGARSDLEGMESILREMEIQPYIGMDWNTYAVAANFYIKGGFSEKAIDALKRSEERLDNKDGVGYNHLISLHASLGNSSDILRLWHQMKTACGRCINQDYITVLKSLEKAGELEEAEKILKEWQLSGNCYDARVPDIVISACLKKGLNEKAEALLKELIEKGKPTTPKSWSAVAQGYVDNGNMEKAIESMKVAISLHKVNKKWKPDPGTIAAILGWLGDAGDSKDIEAFAGLLKTS